MTDRRDINTIIPDPKNPRLHGERNKQQLLESMTRFGPLRGIVVDENGVALAGNGALEAAKAAGISEVEVIQADASRMVVVQVSGLTEEQKAEYKVADNQIGQTSEWDRDILADLAPDIDLSWLFDDDEQAALLPDAEKVALTDPDDVPDTPAIPKTKPGDLYHLGAHRLLCGDATVLSDARRLIDSDSPSMVWTDPPYGVDYVGKTSDAMVIKNDGAQGLPALLHAAFATISAVCPPGTPVYIAHPAGALSLVFGQAVLNAGWRFHETLVWAKDRFVLGRSGYHYQHEPIIFAEVEDGGYDSDSDQVILAYMPGGKGRQGRGGAGWYGDNRQSSVFDIPRPSASRLHPTMKPTELVSRMITNSSPSGGIVLDVFGGSGTTLIACEANDRHCRIMELDPGYCDVIVRRWEEYTGQQAVLIT